MMVVQVLLYIHFLALLKSKFIMPIFLQKREYRHCFMAYNASFSIFLHFFCIFLPNYLVNSKKSSTFAVAFEKQ